MRETNRTEQPRALKNKGNKSKTLTLKQLQIFWKKYSVPKPGEKDLRTLSTTGIRKLILTCFHSENSDEWTKKTSDYSGQPEYPFHQQPNSIKDHIITMLETHPLGKQYVEKLVQKNAEELIAASIRKNYGDNDENQGED